MKIVFLYMCKYSGLFFLSNYLMRKKLLILCYHGFELNNESQFRPQLFIKRTTFERRLKAIKKSSSVVISLDDAVKALETNSLPDNAVVITIDDGFYSVLRIGFPLLQQNDLPATLYLTTMDMQKGLPILRLIIPYMVATTTKESINTSQYKWGCKETINLTFPQDRKSFIESCIFFAEKLESDESIEKFFCDLGCVLGIDYKDVRDTRLLSLLSESEASMLASKGIDIQLHTHTHRFPKNDTETANIEINQNRQILENLARNQLIHFCYPSGQWSTSHWPILKKQGIKSATTCSPGLNDSTVNLLSLNRFLDGENIPDIVFESELYRFNEFTRKLKNLFKWHPVRTPNI